MKVLAMVLAGGEGAPLAAERAKPAVPFAGRNRIVDCVLSNLVNSEIRGIFLLVQCHHQGVEFQLPDIGRASVWQALLDTQFSGEPQARRKFKGGDIYAMEACPLALLIQLKK